MKTKIRRLVSILSAMVLMVCCAVPAFAEDIDISYTTWNDTIKQNVFSCIPDSDKTDYYTVIAAPNGSGFTYTIIFCKSSSSITYFGNNLHCFVSKADYNAFACVLVTSENKPLYDDTATGWRSENGDYFDHEPYDYSGGQAKVIYSNVPVLNWEDKKTPAWKDPNAPPVPFTVDYSPALSEGMSRKGTLVAPGASNNGQEIESNGLNVRVTLTDEFLKLRDSYDELKDYTYEFVCYITTSPPEKSSYEESVKNAVYTSLDYGKYMYTTSGVVDDVTDDNKEPTEWIKAEGINAGYIIGKGGEVKNVTINLENLDSSQFTADTKLYIVVYGRLTSLSVPTPDYFDLDNQCYLCNQGSLNSKQIVTVNADPETGEGIDVVMPDYYCVTSTAFNYKDYPEYKPKIFKNGAEMDTNKPFTDYLDKKLTPDFMYDYDMDKKGESGLAPDDFKKYEEQKNLDKNFGSFDFGLDSIKSVFDGSSDFFKFLTASIGILPTTFLTILIAFFVVMLAICVAKWVLK